MENGTTRRIRRQEGAAAVEFALIVSLLVLLIFGMMEYGLFFLQAQSLRAGAREGARQAAVGADTTEIASAISVGSAGSVPATFTDFTVQVEGTTKICDGDDTQGREVTVAIDTGSGATYPAGLPSAIVGSFKIDIPFLPHLDLHPTIEGVFRCEL